MKRWIALLGVVPLVMAACDWTGVDKKYKPNVSPTVRITGGASEGTEADYRVEFYWFGSDPDGFVDHFVYAIDDTCLCQYQDEHDEWVGVLDPRVCDSLAAAHDSASVEFEFLHEHVDSIWRRIDDFSGSFNFRASTPVDGVDPPRSHDQHAFFVKSVDDRGARSRADFRHFDAITISPTSHILAPVGSGLEKIVTVSTNFNIHWSGRDEDSSRPDKLPAGYQFRMVPLSDWEMYGDDSAAIRAVRDMLRLNVLIPDSIIVTDPDSVTDETFLPSDWYPKHDDPFQESLVHLSEMAAGNYGFVVRAVDEAGAIMPAEAFGVAGQGDVERGNVSKIDINPAIESRPYLTVSERSLLGSRRFISSGARWRVEVPVGVPLFFEWTADASWYGSRVGGFNYALDIQDPSCEVCQADDGIGGWIGWGSWEGVPFSIEFDEEDAGEQHILYVRVRDESFRDDREMLGVIIMDVVSFPLDRTALWIDDFRVSGTNDCEHDAIISPVINHAVSPYLPFGQEEIEEWQSGQAIGECGESTNPRDIRLSQLARYKLIYWNVSGPETTLGTVTDPSEDADAGRYLAAYVQSGGSVIVWGRYDLAALTGDFMPPDRYVPDLPQFPNPNFGPGYFIWDVLRLRTMLDRSGRGDGPGSNQMHIRCSGLVGLEVTQSGREEGFPSGTIDPTGFSEKHALWYDDWSGRLNPTGWSGAHAMIGNPPLYVAGMDTIYNYVSNSWAWREGHLTEACGSSFLSPLHGQPCVVRFDDPDPLSSQGKAVWIGGPLFIFDDNHLEDLKNMMRRFTNWIME